MRKAVTVRADRRKLAAIKLFFERELGYHPDTMAKLHSTAIGKYADVIVNNFPKYAVHDDHTADMILSEGMVDKNINVRKEDLLNAGDNPMMDDVMRALEGGDDE